MGNEIHFSLTTSQSTYEFDLRESHSKQDAITVGQGRYTLVTKNEAERAMIQGILAEALKGFFS